MQLRKFSLPRSLQTMLGDEPIDFAVKARRRFARGGPFGLLLFGLAWTAFSSLFVAVFLGPLYFEGETHFEVNGVPTTASLDNLSPIFVPGLIIGFFLLIGLAMIFFSVVKMREPGGYFVGTPSRLIHYRQGKVEITDWEQFTGNMEVIDKPKGGELIMLLRSGKTTSKGHYTPDKVQMAGIADVFEVEKHCRLRIKENDPTPPAPMERF